MAICRLRSLFSPSKCKSSSFSFYQSFKPRTFSSSHHLPSHLQNVGFIGLGNMGSRMANNLIKAGFSVTVHDLNSDVLDKFSHMGVATKKTPCEVSEASDVVVTMLPSSAHVNDVYTGPNGLLHGGKLLRPWLFIDSSTIDPQTSRNISATISNYILKEKKGDLEKPFMLDAPVSGGVIAAEAGTLTFMVGGSEEAFAAAKPLFFSMGKGAIYCGGAGNGSAAKICNNLALAVSMLGVSEALALGQSLGVAASTLSKIFNCSSARCWSSDSYNPVPGVMEGVPSSRDYNGGFASKLMAKDLNLAAESAKQAGCKHPLTSQAQKIYTELCNEGHEGKDFSCVFRHYYTGMDEHVDQ
ncbi:probable 3-hydroxyisobutyrate dehydrogenase, mitochondrial isoform X1 [Arachis duranensis]|uniref:3-hydroxyisobutyrate dehydrogenase n=1 Tax=Arachis duranensis TaxID=130453 RepID=A0A6P4D0A9_ARADU|nr:probable 3-hydroxyisobutyrate dehydrogenase, mitochondrial isoform X1 [Arachis duranensis]